MKFTQYYVPIKVGPAVTEGLIHWIVTNEITKSWVGLKPLGATNG